MTLDFKVTLLGTGTPVPQMARFGACILIEAGDGKFLFDCGRGAAQRLLQLQIPFSDVSKLFLTHMHSDHLVGIPDLWLTGWIYGRKAPFEVWGPEGTRSMMHHLEKAFEADIHVRRDLDEMFPGEGIRVIANEFQEGVVYDEGGVKITAFDVDHRPVEPAFGFRIDYQGHSVVLSGDTRPSENLVKFARGTDLLIHEVVAPKALIARTGHFASRHQQAIIEHHTTPEQAGEIFANIGAELAVYSHIVGGLGKDSDDELIEGTKKTYSGRFEIGEDLMAFEIGDEVKVISEKQR